jgi:hypothetical protein
MTCSTPTKHALSSKNSGNKDHLIYQSSINDCCIHTHIVGRVWYGPDDAMHEWSRLVLPWWKPPASCMKQLMDTQRHQSLHAASRWLSPWQNESAPFVHHLAHTRLCLLHSNTGSAEQHPGPTFLTWLPLLHWENQALANSAQQHK